MAFGSQGQRWLPVLYICIITKGVRRPGTEQLTLYSSMRRMGRG